MRLYSMALLAVYLAAGCAIHGYSRDAASRAPVEIQEIALEAPLPTDAAVHVPDRRLRSRLGSLSGIWYGRWEGGLASMLLVERINGEKATVVYTWGDDPASGFSRRSKRLVARVKALGVIEFECPENSVFTFELDTPERALAGRVYDGKERDEIIMYRGSRLPGEREHAVSISSEDSIEFSGLDGAVLDTLPDFVHRVLPEYPESALQTGVEGVVLVKIVVDENGEVTSAAPATSDPNPPLVQAALNAARRWRFQSATIEGRSVSCMALVPIRFELR